MGNGDNFALDWIRGELESTLDQARSALESYAEGGREETRLRSCLTCLHQVHGTLRMLELEGVVLLADHMEQTAQSLLNGSIQDARTAEQVLMQTILQLPIFISEVQNGTPDDLPLVMPHVNELRACCGLAPMQLKPPVSVEFTSEAARAVVRRFEAIEGASKAARVRGAYQQVLLSVLRGQADVQTVETLGKIAIGMQRICEGSPYATLWRALRFFANGYSNEPQKMSSEAVRDLRRVDAEMKRLASDGASVLIAPLPVELIRDLLRSAESRGQKDAEITALRSAVFVPQASRPKPREAIEQASAVLREELASVRNNLDLYVRGSERGLAQLLELTEPLEPICATLGMLDEDAARTTLLAQRAQVLGLADDSAIDDDLLLDIASSLVAVDRTLGGEHDEEDSLLSATLNEAQLAVLAEARSGIEQIKQNIVDFVSSKWNVETLSSAPDVLAAVEGALAMVPLPRPSTLLVDCRRYIEDYLLLGYVPDWSELDAFADALGGIDYYLERLYDNSRVPNDEALELVQRSLAELGKGERPVLEPAVEPIREPIVEDNSPIVVDFEFEDEEAIPFEQDADIELPFDLDDEPLDDGDPLGVMLGAQPEELAFLSSQESLPPQEPEELVNVVESAEVIEGSLAAGIAVPPPQHQPVTSVVPIDNEIVEIFIEEVDEVHANLETALIAWSANPDADAAVTELRRGFHTLKGSGRMVAANQISDLAWSMENMLNRVLDGTLKVTEDHQLLVNSACQQIQLLKQAFAAGSSSAETGGHTEAGALELIEQADVLASGGSLAHQLVDEDDYLDEQDFPIVDVPSFVDAPPSETSEAELSLFAEEALEHLAVLQDKIQCAVGADYLDLDAEFTRALHTVAGSAATTGRIDVVGIAEPLQEVCTVTLRERSGRLEGDCLAFVSEGVYALERLLDPDAATGVKLDESDLFAAEAERLVRAFTFDVSDTSEAADLVVEAQPQQDSVSHTDRQAPVMAESVEALVDAREFLDSWRDGSLDLARGEQMRLGLAELVSSDLAPEISALSENLLELHKLFEDGPLVTELHAGLSAGHDELLLCLDAIAADQPVPSVTDTMQRLRDLIAPPDASEPGFDLSELDGDFTQYDAPTQAPAKASPDAENVAAPALFNNFEEPPGETLAEPQADPEDEIDPEIVEIFFEEADEILEQLDRNMQSWDGDRGNSAYLDNLLRGLHTLKGGARLAGLLPVGDLAHNFESELITLQDLTVPIDDLRFTAVQTQHDELGAAVAAARDGEQQPLQVESKVEVEVEVEVEAETGAAIDDKLDLQTLFGATASQQGTTAAINVDIQIEPSVPVVEPPPEVSDPRANQEVVRVSAGLLEDLVNLAGESSIVRARMEQGISDFGGALEEMETTIERVREQLRRLEIETEAQVLYRHERSHERKEDPQYAEFDPLEMDRYSQLQQLTRSLTESATDMLDLKETLRFRAREAETLLLQQARLNTELQEGLMRTRMVPFSRLMPRLRRIVRQVSRDLDKQVEFHAYNAEGELDRNILERMVPPLEHMLRNAIDHGIEMPNERQNYGKPSAGRIDLRLTREGGDVVIEISDDGAGIDVETVRAKAIERGLLSDDADLSDEQVLEFVLAAGFTTAKSLTQISGRGVGMDVVQSEVKQLGGSISISSTPGRGTCFTVRLPFTVSVNRALMVTLADDQYAIPLNTIEGIVLLTDDKLAYHYGPGAPTFDYAGIPYQVRYLGNYLGREYVPKSDRSTVPVVLVRSGDHVVAVHVDGVQGSREIVVKSLGPQFAGVGGISGATILGDGSVVVILDLLALIRSQGMAANVGARAPASSAEEPIWVLVVDDSVTVRKVTSRLLERQGMNVMIAKDGVEAIASLQERRPDIVLLDIEMPRMDGFEVARQVRHDERLAGLPIVMISSRSGKKHTDRAFELGVKRFLSKPFQENELLEIIEELVTR